MYCYALHMYKAILISFLALTGCGKAENTFSNTQTTGSVPAPSAYAGKWVYVDESSTYLLGVSVLDLTFATAGTTFQGTFGFSYGYDHDNIECLGSMTITPPIGNPLNQHAILTITGIGVVKAAVSAASQCYDIQNQQYSLQFENGKDSTDGLMATPYSSSLGYGNGVVLRIQK